MQGGDPRMGSAVQVLAMQLPRILGASRLAPEILLRSQGGGGPQGLAAVRDVGPRTSGIANAVAQSVLADVITRSGAPGVGTDLSNRSMVRSGAPSPWSSSVGSDRPSEGPLPSRPEAPAPVVTPGRTGPEPAPTPIFPSQPAPSGGAETVWLDNPSVTAAENLPSWIDAPPMSPWEQEQGGYYTPGGDLSGLLSLFSDFEGY